MRRWGSVAGRNFAARRSPNWSSSLSFAVTARTVTWHGSITPSRFAKRRIPHLEGIAYDFRVCGSPNELFDFIVKQNAVANKARVVAGYCWAWKGKKDPTIKDVVIEKHGFAKRWNLDKDGPLWLVAPNSVEEVGCIHTCQGLELDYVGVIIGPDLIVRDGRVLADAGKRSGQDRSIHGYKKLLKEDPARARALADRIIKSTYRTLMTRGQKGCYLFCVDDETNSYFAEFAESLRTPTKYLEAAEGDRGPGTGDSLSGGVRVV